MARLTLEEIGRRAGVSRSTVSRVVNGHPDVSPDVQQRVMDVIRATGYRPNQAARSLVSNRSGLIGLVIPSDVHSVFADPYFGRLIQGMTGRANKTDQTLSLFLFEDEREEMEMYPRVIVNALVDGVIVTATRMGNPLVERMVEDGTSFVMVGRPDTDGISYVDVDNRDGAARVTAHLIEHGRTRLATVAAPSNTTTGVDRRSGFLDAVSAAGLDVAPGGVVEGDYTDQGGYDAMVRLLEGRPDAVFCASDTMAVGALRALADAGVSCPGDVAVAGFDGLLGAHETDPSLTTVTQPVGDTGAAAVDLLLDVLEADDGAVRQRILPTELTIRQSCGCHGEN
jgi:LacI family transcriptional regulator